jgi:alpha-tubulin suppressor-like RCC1 family protein
MSVAAMGIYRFFVCLFLLLLSSASFSFNNETFTYDLSGNDIEITGCVDICPQNMIIPNEIDGQIVKKISPDSFYQSNINTVVIPNSITSIGSNAFGSNNLSEVVLPLGLQYMGPGAFQYNNLTDVVLSEGITHIANYLFKGNQLQGIDLPDSVIDIGWHAFLDNPGKIGENFNYFRINDEVELIGCADICPQNLVIPSQIDGLNVTRIQEYAFGGDDIHTLVLPETIEHISPHTFIGNINLTNITIENHDAIISQNVFTGSSGLIAGDFRFLIYNDDAMIIGCRNQCPKQISIPNNITGYDVKYIGDFAFRGQEISNVILPDGILKIGSYAFNDNELTEVNLPSSLISVGMLAYNNNQIDTLIIPKNVNNLGHWSFERNNISQVSFLGDKPMINQGAFDANDISNITYCQSKTGWDNSMIYGISPVPDCDSDGVLDSMDLEPNDSSISFRVALEGSDGFTQFDPKTGSNAIVLSDENLTVSTIKSSEGAESFPILSKDSISSGKHYWEIEAKCGPDSLGFSSGLIRLEDSLTDAVIWSVGSDGYRSNGQWLGSYGELTVSGDTFHFAVDLDLGYLFIGKNGVWSNNSDPELGLNPIYSDVSGPVFARVDLGLRECQRLPIVANFGNREFNHKVPQGYYKGFCPSGECVVADYGNDSDNDGLPNDYETANSLNPVDASDAQSDSDMDGLTTLEEFNLGTSPTNDDTDGDTLPDGWEVENGRDSLVADYQVASGGDFNCALDDSGLVCWGDNEYGQTNVPTLEHPFMLSLGRDYSCALNEFNAVCWGRNNHNQLETPDLIAPSTISSGEVHACAIDDTGLVCWGFDAYGRASPPDMSEVLGVSSGHAHSCAFNSNEVICWGYNDNGQIDVPSVENPVQIASGEYHNCVIDNSNILCWGNNDYGQSNAPEVNNPTDISLGSWHSCAIADNDVSCWGKNDYGQTNVPNLSNPVQISTGDNHTCALDDTGVVCWGENSANQLDTPENLFDPDNDGFSNQNGTDAFPLDSTEWIDTDLDGIGNNADTDDDNDGFEDTHEIQNGLDPIIANLDIDIDGIANELDADNDNDGTEDAFDLFPFNSSEQLDHDNDGIGNNADTDDDGDGVNDALDLFPLDAFESADSDGDGLGDNADFFPNSAEYSLDSDLDQMPDAWERKYGLNPTDASDALLDQDNDGLTALEEYEAGTIPLKILDIDANGSFDALTDGLIILRYAFNLRGESLTNGVISEDAMRTNPADIEAYIQSLMPDF